MSDSDLKPCGCVYYKALNKKLEESQATLERLRAGCREVLNDMYNTHPRDDYFIGRLEAALEKGEEKAGGFAVSEQ